MSTPTAGMLIVIDIPLFVTFLLPSPRLPCFVLVSQCERVMYLSEYGHFGVCPSFTLDNSIQTDNGHMKNFRHKFGLEKKANCLQNVEYEQDGR